MRYWFYSQPYSSWACKKILSSNRWYSKEPDCNKILLTVHHLHRQNIVQIWTYKGDFISSIHKPTMGCLLLIFWKTLTMLSKIKLYFAAVSQEQLNQTGTTFIITYNIICHCSTDHPGISSIYTYIYEHLFSLKCQDVYHSNTNNLLLLLTYKNPRKLMLQSWKEAIEELISREIWKINYIFKCIKCFRDPFQYILSNEHFMPRI